MVTCSGCYHDNKCYNNYSHTLICFKDQRIFKDNLSEARVNIIYYPKIFSEIRQGEFLVTLL